MHWGCFRDPRHALNAQFAIRDVNYHIVNYHIVTRGGGWWRLLPGRFRAIPAEDEGYDGSISRSLHVNPRVGRRLLAKVQEKYPHSRYAGYVRTSRRMDWIDYDSFHPYWVGRRQGAGDDGGCHE